MNPWLCSKGSKCSGSDGKAPLTARKCSGDRHFQETFKKSPVPPAQLLSSFVGSQISCFSPSNFTGKQSAYADTACWDSLLHHGFDAEGHAVTKSLWVLKVCRWARMGPPRWCLGTTRSHHDVSGGGSCRSKVVQHLTPPKIPLPWGYSKMISLTWGWSSPPRFSRTRCW